MQHLKQDTADSPAVHFISVSSRGEQAFRRAVPASGDVFGKRAFGVKTAAGAKVGEFDDDAVFYLFPNPTEGPPNFSN